MRNDILHGHGWCMQQLLYTMCCFFGDMFCSLMYASSGLINKESEFEHARISSRQHFRGLRGKGFPTDSRHSNGHKLCTSPSRHISVLMRSGIQSLLSTGKKKWASQFNFTYRYIDDVLSINNPDFVNYLGQMYPAELEIKHTTESNTSASYLDLVLSIESDGQLRTFLYDKHDDFNFHITNFPFLSSNIPSSPAYSVFISQLIRYARACSSYECFILRAAQLSSKLLGQGYVMERSKSSLRKFYGRYGDLIKHYEVSLSQMLHDILGHDHVQWHPQLIRHYTNLRTYYRTGLYYRFWPYYQFLEVSIEHCNGCG